MPRERKICGNADRLLFMPHERFQQDDKSEPRAIGIPDDVPDVSYDDSLVTREF